MVLHTIAVVGAGTGCPTAGRCSTREYGILGSAYSSDGSGGLKRTLGIAPATGACIAFTCTACVTSTFLGTGFWTLPVALASTEFAMAPPWSPEGPATWPSPVTCPLCASALAASPGFGPVGPLPAPAAFHRRILRRILPLAVHQQLPDTPRR